MQKLLLVMSVLVGLMPPAVARNATVLTEIEDVMTMRVDAEVVVDASGRLVSHSIKTELPADLRMALDKGIGAWQFDPPEQALAGSSTPVRITLAARSPAPNALEIRLDNISFPSTKKEAGRLVLKSKYPSPEFPSLTVSGIVTVDFSVGSDGRVVDIAATQCSLHNIKATPEQKSKACAEMEKNGLRAVRRWRFGVVGNEVEPSYPLTATVPLHYIWPRHRFDDEAGKWRKESRTAYRQPAWKPVESGVAHIGSSDVNDSALVQGDPALRLKDGFIGRVL